MASELVPGGLAVALGLALVPFVSPLTAALAGALAWPLASALVRALRRRTWLRRIYRTAFLAHVLFWSVQGVLATRHEPARPVRPAGLSAWRAPATLRAGYGTAAFHLPAGTTLAGWGSRPRRVRWPMFLGAGPVGRWSQRWMAEPGADGAPRLPLYRGPAPDARGETLGARALVLRAGEGAGDPPAGIVRVDLVTSDARLHAAVTAAVADLGFRPETVIVAATHTHSGPGGYADNALSALLGTDHYDPRVFAAVRDAAASALRQAWKAAVPARLAVVQARDRAGGRLVLARSRGPEGPDKVDDRVLLWRVDRAADGSPLAVVLNYAVHPVLYRRQHMAFARDLAGSMEEALSAELGGGTPVLFLNGAEGDITEQPAPGTVQERLASLSRAFARAVAPAVRAAAGHGATRVRLACAQVTRRLATPRVNVTLAGSRAATLTAVDRPWLGGDAADVLADLLSLPANLLVWTQAVPEARLGFSWDGGAGVCIALTPLLGHEPEPFGAWVLEFPGAGGPRRSALLWEPGEAVESLGRAWRAAATGRGLPETLVVGLANGSCAYLTPEALYREGGYEARGTFFGPRSGADAGEALVAALDAALGALR
jgi:hypothetical protein